MPTPATFYDGVAGMAVLDAIRQSAEDQRYVPVARIPVEEAIA